MAAAMRWPFFIGLTSLDHWLAPCDRPEDSGRSRSCRSLIAIREKYGLNWWYGWKMRTRIDLLSHTCEQSERYAPRRRDHSPAGLRVARWNSRPHVAKACRGSRAWRP